MAVRGLVARELVVELPRRPGQKEERYAHVLAGPPTEQPAERESVASSAGGGEPRDDRIAELEGTVDELRREPAELRSQFEEFRRQFG